MRMKDKGKIVNKKAKFEYQILETVEAGLVLSGNEVKSLRSGRGSLVDAFVQVRDGEAFLVNASIPGYNFADNREYDSKKTRKLLMHKSEIYSLEQKKQNKGVSLVPLEIYLKKGKFKVRVGVGKGRKQYQKKELLKQRDLDREVLREMRGK